MVNEGLPADAEILGNLGIGPALGLEVVDERIKCCPVVLGFRHMSS